MKRISFILAVSIISINISAQFKAKVIGISDGDTITVLSESNTQIKIRLAEVDCPESKQPFGNNAKQYTSSQVFGKQIIFYQTDEDRYGRTIAKVYYDSGKYLSEEIIKAGMGWWYFKYSNNKKLGEIQNQAKSKRLGLWQDKNPIAPYVWRKLSKIEKYKYNEKKP